MFVSESLSYEGVVGRSADRLGGCGAKVSAPVSDMLGVRFGHELNCEVNRNGGSETDVLAAMGGETDVLYALNYFC